MGNDGGSIPTRRELVKEAARNPSTTQLKETQNEQQQFHWTTCPLSQRPLSAPVVSDSAGTLYCKDAVLEWLIEAGQGVQGTADAAKEEIFKSRVRSIRDVVEVKFQVEGENRFENSSTTIKWVCPVTKKTLGPGVKAVYLVPCGHAFLESAVKEMPGENCLHCNECYTPDNIISILPSSTREQERLKTRAERLNQQGLTHSLKKATGASKKRKKNVVAADALISKQVLDESKPPLRPSEGTSSTSRASINNEETASLTAKVIAEEQDRHKRRRMGANENLKSLFSSKNGMDEKHTDFMTRGFSIPSVSGSKR